MNTIRTLAALLTAFLSLAAPSASQAQSPDLRVLQAEYDNQLLDRVTAVYNAALARLDAIYLAGLDRSFTEATTAGDLEGALSLQAEKKRVAGREALPATDETATNALKKLRAIYRAELVKLDAQRAANQTAILPPHIAKLKQLEVELTKANRLSDAKAVLDYRQGLAAGVPVKAAGPEAVASAPGVVKNASPPIPFGARLASNMKVYASGNNNCTVHYNGKELMKVMRDKAGVASHSVKEGDVITVKLADRFSDNCFWLSAIAASGEFLFETSEQWTGYLPTDDDKWWDIKNVKEQKPVEFAKFTSNYIDLIKKAASATPHYDGTQPIHSLLDGTRKSFFYYVVTKADLVPKQDRKIQQK